MGKRSPFIFFFLVASLAQANPRCRWDNFHAENSLQKDAAGLVETYATLLRQGYEEKALTLVDLQRAETAGAEGDFTLLAGKQEGRYQYGEALQLLTEVYQHLPASERSRFHAAVKREIGTLVVEKQGAAVVTQVQEKKNRVAGPSFLFRGEGLNRNNVMGSAWVAAGGKRGVVEDTVWDFANGVPIRKLTALSTDIDGFSSRGSGRSSVVWGDQIAYVSTRPGGGEQVIWEDLYTGKATRPPVSVGDPHPGHPRRHFDLVLSSDGRQLAYSAYWLENNHRSAFTIGIIPADPTKAIHVQEFQNGRIGEVLAVAPDGQSVFTKDFDDNLTEWRMTKPSGIRSLWKTPSLSRFDSRLGAGLICQMVADPVRDRLFFSLPSGSILFTQPAWSSDRGYTELLFPYGAFRSSVSFSGNGERAAVYSLETGIVLIYDLTNVTNPKPAVRVQLPTGGLSGLSLSNDGFYLLVHRLAAPRGPNTQFHLFDLRNL